MYSFTDVRVTGRSSEQILNFKYEKKIAHDKKEVIKYNANAEKHWPQTHVTVVIYHKPHQRGLAVVNWMPSHTKKKNRVNENLC